MQRRVLLEATRHNKEPIRRHRSEGPSSNPVLGDPLGTPSDLPHQAIGRTKWGQPRLPPPRKEGYKRSPGAGATTARYLSSSAPWLRRISCSPQVPLSLSNPTAPAWRAPGLHRAAVSPSRPCRSSLFFTTPSQKRRAEVQRESGHSRIAQACLGKSSPSRARFRLLQAASISTRQAGSWPLELASAARPPETMRPGLAEVGHSFPALISVPV